MGKFPTSRPDRPPGSPAAARRARSGGRKTEVTTTANKIVPTAPKDQSHREDIGSDSAGEIARKDVRIDELQTEKRQLEIKAVGLRSEIDELKAAAEGAPKARTTQSCSRPCCSSTRR